MSKLLENRDRDENMHAETYQNTDNVRIKQLNYMNDIDIFIIIQVQEK